MRAKFVVPIVLAIASACHDGPIEPKIDTTPAKETLSVTLEGPADGSVIRGLNPAVSAKAIVLSNKGPVSGSNVTWKLNGSPVTTGMDVSLSAIAGENNLCADVQGVVDASVEKCLKFTFTPAAACRVVRDYPVSSALTGAPLRITFTKGSQSVSRTVGTDGDCSIESPLVLLGAGDTVRFVLDVESGTRTHNAVLGYADKADLDKGLTLIQMSKVYPASGTEVSVDLALCYVAGSDGRSFCQRQVVPNSGGKYQYDTRFFLPSALPLPTRLSNDPEAISPARADSFWAAASRMNQLLGFTFVRPAATGDVVNGSTAGYLVNMKTTPGSTSAVSGVTAEDASYLGGFTTFYGEEAIRSITTLHEMTHVLGMGHGCGFPSIMAVYCGPNGFQEAAEPTAYDIAYVLQKIRVRELERQFSTKFSYCENHQGLRVVERGQTEEYCFKGTP